MNFGKQDLEEREKTEHGTASIDWIARARDLAPVIEAASDRIESERRIPGDLMSALHDAELFRMCLPRSMGGGEATSLAVELVNSDRPTALGGKLAHLTAY